VRVRLTSHCFSPAGYAFISSGPRQPNNFLTSRPIPYLASERRSSARSRPSGFGVTDQHGVIGLARDDNLSVGNSFHWATMVESSDTAGLQATAVLPAR